MNVSELRQQLQDLEEAGCGEREVLFTYNYGDYWRTTVAVSVDSLEEGQVKYSSYHSMDKVVDEEDTDAEHRQVILIG